MFLAENFAVFIIHVEMRRLHLLYTLIIITACHVTALYGGNKYSLTVELLRKPKFLTLACQLENAQRTSMNQVLYRAFELPAVD